MDADVVVIGGGAAGLSAALMLVRSKRTVVVVDAGQPRNAPAHAMHGFLSRDGMNPLDLLVEGRREVESYGGTIRRGEAATARAVDGGFEVDLADGGTLTARRLVVTTGLVDELPDIPGLAERWGRTVVHCPYCHGWEVRDQQLVVIGTNHLATHQALLFRQLSDDVRVVLHGDAPDPTPDEAEQLDNVGVAVTRGRITRVDDAGAHLDDGTLVPAEAFVVSTHLVARSSILADLGVTVAEHPSGMGEHVPADPTGGTNVPGVWVAGNVTDIAAQVMASAAQGAMAGARVNADLVAEDARRR
jgi:thioredoxin reductase